MPFIQQGSSCRVKFRTNKSRHAQLAASRQDRLPTIPAAFLVALPLALPWAL